jgi:hypothetical protein
LIERPWPNGFPSVVTSGSVLLFSCQIESPISGRNEDSIYGVNNGLHSDDSEQARVWFYSEMSRLVEKIHSNGVKIVISQKKMSKILQNSLAKRGILSIDKLGIDQIRTNKALLTDAVVVLTCRLFLCISRCGTIAFGS